MRRALVAFAAVALVVAGAAAFSTSGGSSLSDTDRAAITDARAQCATLAARVANKNKPYARACVADLDAVLTPAGSTTTAATPTTVVPTSGPTTTRSSTLPATTVPAPTTTATTVPGSVAVTPAGPGGSWRLVFADEFDGVALDGSKWNTSGSWECCDGGRSNAGNGELDYKTDGQNFSFAGGLLTIQARREASGHGQAWTSGQLGSKQSFTYAFVENRAKFASPKGFLNALWTWGAPGTNVSAQETDVFEFYSDNHSRVYVTSHASGGGGCGAVTLGFDPTAAFHTYGADIQATGTDWYVDGVKVCHAAGHPTQAWNIVDYMTVNAASRGPVADPSTTHAEYIIDYERAWVR